jgi:hypothetical protein
MSGPSLPNAATSPGDPVLGQEASVTVNDTERNGAAHAASATTPAPKADENGADATRMKRAEQLTDRLAENVSWLGQKLRYFAARTREAVSDFWAEVQNVRRGDK